jgi:pyridoxal phosphate enzyme (YggS family)
MPFEDVAKRVALISDQIAGAARKGGHRQTVTVVAVTKSHGVDAVAAAVDAGLSNVGENKVQEALTKQALFSGRVRWHLIGHLQRNKVRHLRSFSLFHALDSARLADAIEKEFEGDPEPFPVLLQVNVSSEQSKGGYPLSDVSREAERLMSFRHLSVQGVMTMAPLDASDAELRRVFSGAREARNILKAAGHQATELSMGMSQDFQVAVEEGATLVRLGTVLFGART